MSEEPVVSPINDNDTNQELDASSSPPTSEFLKNLQILPPLQSTSKTHNDSNQYFDNTTPSSIPLPPLRAEEPVSSIRAALSEVRGYAHITHYRLTLTTVDATTTSGSLASSANPGSQHDSTPHSNGSKSKKSKKKSKQQQQNQGVISRYTGPNAMVMIPGNAGGGSEGEIILDDYGDLKPLLEDGLNSGSCFRMVLERYDAAGVRDHVARLRNLLDGGAPFVTSLVEEDQSKPSKEVNGAPSVAPSVKPGEEKEKVKEKENVKTKENQTTQDTKSIEPDQKESSETKSQKHAPDDKRDQSSDPLANNNPLFEKIPSEVPSDKKIVPDMLNLTNFYSYATGEDPPSPPASPSDPTKLNIVVRYSGYHPPTPQRRGMGDLTYLEVVSPGVKSEGVIYITATAVGFYVNKTTDEHGFDPTPLPGDENCYSHELLDCVLRRSKTIRLAWAKALAHAKSRSPPNPNSPNNSSTPLQSLHTAATTPPYTTIDTLLLRPSWLSLPPYPQPPQPSPHRAEDDLTFSHGLDIRSGAPRDWNEELQSAREMPVLTLEERIDRARTIHKVMADFGDAAVLGVLAIADGHLAPMNPNENCRSHVYLHNNIFFSRAVDAGVDTFKIVRGDGAARKSAGRDCSCMSSLHRLDVEGLYTCATVLVDYLGMRIVCQCVVPGILHGEKSHTLLYGAVEAGAPLSWSEEMHGLLEKSIGKECMIATRRVWKHPLKDERVEEIRGAGIQGVKEVAEEKDTGTETDDEMITICGPLEAKGIKGSDQRKYVLDVTRLTPRDANWVSKELGGTGNWERVWEEDMKGRKGAEKEKREKYIPKCLDDEEWAMAVLRPEFISSLTHKNMMKFLEKEREEAEKSKQVVGTKSQEPQSETVKSTDGYDSTEIKKEPDDKKASANTGSDIPLSTKLPTPTESLTVSPTSPASESYLQSLRYNINVFLPHTKPLPLTPQLTTDEDRVREASNYLFDTLLTTLTTDLRESSGHLIPVDGNALVELLHTRGINIRYLGRLAQLAQADKHSSSTDVKGKKLPQCWLELLECEMIARAGKHVLDQLLTDHGGVAAQSPSRIIATVLSALCTTGEESASETEKRLTKNTANTDTQADVFADEEYLNIPGDACVASPNLRRSEVWDAVERDIGRRYRYTITQYNTKDGKGSSLPLLRRLCQRCGVRIAAKRYNLGCKALLPSYPIAPEDILDILPLVKHAGAHGGEGFHPSTPPSLHIILPDAKSTFERAHAAWTVGQLPQALDLAQEAVTLYQRVTDTPLHVSVVRCLDLMAVILFQAREVEMAATNAARALAASVQLGGFDCAEALAGHTTLAHILISGGGLAGAAKHLKAASYLMEIMGGGNYTDLASLYHKLGSLFHEVGSVNTALAYYELAGTKPVSDPIMESMIAKRKALVLASTHQFKLAAESEKRAYGIYQRVFGNEHELTVNSANCLKQFTALAVEQGSRLVAEEKKRKEEEEARNNATRMVAEIEEEESKKKKKSKKKNKKRS
eukprot:CAMPEP_0172490946 /NCGR_PEP_ID=MMETSP1066-20121228/21577_1 /TAXON_ID=671091 /ORGANISM="Coscinodiscus wailesii, Strain CCMP2513" /LENGTH=1498 /DNA_ID=CAMNT_0013259693 /DNA_START=166 /DNA_END=4662 /DNA_ORIENTATION=-